MGNTLKGFPAEFNALHMGMVTGVIRDANGTIVDALITHANGAYVNGRGHGTIITEKMSTIMREEKRTYPTFAIYEPSSEKIERNIASRR
jgi:hypothetical protein